MVFFEIIEFFQLSATLL